VDVPHYERECGEPFVRHLETEFGSTLAAAVVEGGVLSPVLRDGLNSATNRAIADRDRFVDILDRERESLEECRKRLNQYEAAAHEIGLELEGEPGGLPDVGDELLTLQRNCEAVASRRQSTIHNRSVERVSGIDDHSLVRYLYGDTGRTFPVLGDCLDCLETIQHYLDRAGCDVPGTSPSVETPRTPGIDPD